VAGWVKRAGSAADRRQVVLTLTAAGRGAVDEIEVVRRQLVAHLVDEWSDEALGGLIAGLERLSADLSAAQPTPPWRDRGATATS
jgi:DNA-binding MarR family transcriptional regulator